MPQATRSKVTKRKLESSATEKENKALKTNQRAVERRKSLDDTKKESLLAHLNKESLKVKEEVIGWNPVLANKLLLAGTLLSYPFPYHAPVNPTNLVAG